MVCHDLSSISARPLLLLQQQDNNQNYLMKERGNSLVCSSYNHYSVGNGLKVQTENFRKYTYLLYWHKSEGKDYFPVSSYFLKVPCRDGGTKIRLHIHTITQYYLSDTCTSVFHYKNKSITCWVWENQLTFQGNLAKWRWDSHKIRPASWTKKDAGWR